MAKRWLFGAFAVCLAVTAAGVAAADSYASSKALAFYSAGHHQFYVWCAGAKDYKTLSSGRNAEDAQLRLYDLLKAKGQTACWPVWQGKVPG
jgi:hypothetical protein